MFCYEFPIRNRVIESDGLCVRRKISLGARGKVKLESENREIGSPKNLRNMTSKWAKDKIISKWKEMSYFVH